MMSFWVNELGLKSLPSAGGNETLLAPDITNFQTPHASTTTGGGVTTKPMKEGSGIHLQIKSHSNT